MSVPLKKRNASIDVMRGLTMVIMIFVNDLGSFGRGAIYTELKAEELGSLRGIPDWIGHMKAGVDGIGLADVVFPAFLFIVGMSVVYAIQNRQSKAENSIGKIIAYITMRSLALIIMGTFIANGAYVNPDSSVPRVVWYPLICVAFILIWNDYPEIAEKRLTYFLRILGLIILITLFFVFQHDNVSPFKIRRLGILGSIGIAYFISALIVVFFKDLRLVIMSWIIFCLLSMVKMTGYFDHSVFSFLIRNATLIAFSLGGVLLSLIYQYYNKHGKSKWIIPFFFAYAVLLFILSQVARSFWAVSKLGSTPSWLFLSTAIVVGFFAIVYWLVEKRGKGQWFNFIKPAGTDTLLCYLIPFFIYFGISLFGLQWHQIFLTGYVGLLKSFLIAMTCVWITFFLNRIGIRLKL